MTKSNYQLTKEWMQKFGQETPDKPCVPSLEIRKLRARLIMEEALETILGLGFVSTLEHAEAFLHSLHYVEPDLTQVLDGLIDLEFVASQGTAIACGFSEELMKEAYEEVTRSNMSKLWTKEEVLSKWPDGKAVMDAGFSAQFVNSHKDKTWLVKNKEGKVIKSPSYSPANLKPILEKYTNANI